MMLAPTQQNAQATIFVDGVAHTVEAGLSIAAALTQCSRPDFSTDAAGKKRGVFCGMGVCHDCLVTVDGRTSQRACMTPVADGMHIDRQQAQPGVASAEGADLRAIPESIEQRSMDLLIIGPGPAGLSAAIAAASAGASVTIVDERHSAGGQFYKQPNTSSARRE